MKTKVKTYLAGSIESAENLGMGWRNEITPFLESINIEVFDPCQLEHHKLKGAHTKRLPEGMSHWHELKSSTEPHLRSRFKNYMRKIILFDIDIVKQMDIIILYWDRWSAGTAGEATVAFLDGIPVLTVATVELPAWVAGCSTKIFKDFDSLKTYLRKEYE